MWHSCKQTIAIVVPDVLYVLSLWLLSRSSQHLVTQIMFKKNIHKVHLFLCHAIISFLVFDTLCSLEKIQLFIKKVACVFLSSAILSSRNIWGIIDISFWLTCCECIIVLFVDVIIRCSLWLWSSFIFFLVWFFWRNLGQSKLMIRHGLVWYLSIFSTIFSPH